MIRIDGAAWSPWPWFGFRSRCDLDPFEFARSLSFERLRDGCDVFWRVAAATAGDIDEAVLCKATEEACHVARAQIESGLGERVRQARIWVTRDGDVGLLGELFEEGVHEIGAERAVEAD